MLQHTSQLQYSVNPKVNRNPTHSCMLAQYRAHIPPRVFKIPTSRPDAGPGRDIQRPLVCSASLPYKKCSRGRATCFIQPRRSNVKQREESTQPSKQRTKQLLEQRSWKPRARRGVREVPLSGIKWLTVNFLFTWAQSSQIRKKSRCLGCRSEITITLPSAWRTSSRSQESRCASTSDLTIPFSSPRTSLAYWNGTLCKVNARS